ncbi:hypothetical protein [Micromonospora marina]|uniref:hypothetical protein n=1 Tax=Micromonospora marina TaxID=307120 RepID=UPI003454FACA
MSEEAYDWSAGTWLNPPERAEPVDGGLLVEPRGGSDFWRRGGARRTPRCTRRAESQV